MQDFTRMPTTTLASDTQHARVARGAAALMRRAAAAWDPHRLSILRRIGAPEFVGTRGCALRESDVTQASGYTFAPEEAGSHFKRLRLRDKLLVEFAVEEHD